MKYETDTQKSIHYYLFFFLIETNIETSSLASFRSSWFFSPMRISDSNINSNLNTDSSPAPSDSPFLISYF